MKKKYYDHERNLAKREHKTRIRICLHNINLIKKQKQEGKIKWKK